jgi:predicted negative regulator of RcsB-dependent stress response
MAYDLEEQEQIASMKAFWNKYGTPITWVLIIGMGSFAGYNYWNHYQRTQSSEASALYDQLQKSALGKDNTKVQRIASDVTAKYKGSTYAPMSAMAAAKSAFDAGDLNTAKTQLQWVLEHGNEEYQSLAKLRLAGVQLDEKAYDEALKTLSGTFLPQFAGAVHDRKGDVLVEQNKLAEARAAYQAALKEMDEKNPGRQLVQLKLDAIGGAPAEAPKAAA